jgi:hypothetical protein
MDHFRALGTAMKDGGRSIALLAALATAACGQPSPTSGSSSPGISSASVVASGPGVSLNVPEGWGDLSKREFETAKLNPGVEGVVYLQRNGDPQQYLFLLRQSTAALSSSGNQSPPTLAQVASSQFQVEARVTGCGGPNNQTPGLIAGSLDTSADFDCSQSKGKMERMIVAVHGSYAYLLYFVVHSSGFTADAADLNRILASWHWLD